ncbi:MAG: DUF3037 domain-containing protein [Gammaproteobacteria bacterium]|nr:DUF3037 domain-containing protein [Gammaproteobacteria bacterium]
MTKIPCQYVIVRFAPFTETGEFANVGIILMAPRQRYFGFKLLAPRRHGRITRFFDELEPRLFRETLRDLSEELARVHGVLKAHGFDKRLKVNEVDFAGRLFTEVTRPRESIVRFSETRLVLAEDPKEKLKELFAFYIERNFVTKEYKEIVLERGVRKWLLDARIADRFDRMKVGDDEYQATFPFVEQHENRPAKIIKPLNLTQDTSSKILEHGGNWWFKIRELQKRHTLPDKVLFAVEGPATQGPMGNAYHEVVEMLRETGVTVLPYQHMGEIVDFALNA